MDKIHAEEFGTSENKAVVDLQKPALQKPALQKPAPSPAARPNTSPKTKKRRRLKVAHPERCIGCLGCMFACSRIRTGTVSLQNSAIKIQTQGGIEGDFRVVVCRNCEDPPCARACTEGALEKKPAGGVVFHKDLCKGCGKCEKACLIGAISMGKEKRPIKCIHCGACAEFCPHGVLEIEETPTPEASRGG